MNSLDIAAIFLAEFLSMTGIFHESAKNFHFQ
jgi:hypothetical protein